MDGKMMNALELTQVVRGSAPLFLKAQVASQNLITSVKSFVKAFMSCRISEAEEDENYTSKKLRWDRCMYYPSRVLFLIPA